MNDDDWETGESLKILEYGVRKLSLWRGCSRKVAWTGGFVAYVRQRSSAMIQGGGRDIIDRHSSDDSSHPSLSSAKINLDH